jgi:hypothetical protein
VDVWGASIGIIERANPHEADSGSGLRVVAPEGNLAGGAARDLLASSACRWRIDDLRLARGVHDSIRLVEGVERVGCAGLALAPATVAGVDNERRAGQSIPDLAASASAFHGGPPTNDDSNTSSRRFTRNPIYLGMAQRIRQAPRPRLLRQRVHDHLGEQPVSCPRNLAAGSSR